MDALSSRRTTRVAQCTQNPWILAGGCQQEMLGHDLGLRPAISQNSRCLGMQCQTFFSLQQIICCFTDDAVREHYWVRSLHEIGSDEFFGQHDPTINFQAGKSRHIAKASIITNDRGRFS